MDTEIKATRTSRGGKNQFSTEFKILDKLMEHDQNQCKIKGVSLDKSYMTITDFYENYCNIYNVLKATGKNIK